MFVPKFEDYIFFHILRNFESLTDNATFIKHLSKISTILRDRIFNGLSIFDGCINKNYLQLFCNKDLPLKNVFLNNNIEDKELSKKFLQTHQFESVEILQMSYLNFIEVFQNVNSENLNKLVVHHCTMAYFSVFYEKYYKNDKCPEKKPRYTKSPPIFKNLTFLDISNINVDDEHFYFVMRGIERLEKIDISNTQISDIRPLKFQKNLVYLHYSGIESSEADNSIHLQCLDKLKWLTLDVNSSRKLDMRWLNYINPVIESHLSADEKEFYLKVPEKFQSKEFWSHDEFIQLACWKNLEFFHISGNWDFSESSAL